MKVLVIENEPATVRHLTDLLFEIEREVQIAHVADNAMAGSVYLQQRTGIDLVFMDLATGDDCSCDVFRDASIDTPVICIANCQDYALQAFKLNSIDYLLKPLQKEDLADAICKYRKWHYRHKQPISGSLYDMLQALAVKEAVRSRFLARSGTRYISVAAEEVAYFYTKGKIQYIKTCRNEDLIIDKRLEEIEATVHPGDFFRVNRQFIISYAHIEKVHAWFSGKLKVQVNPAAYEDIIVSRMRATTFKKWLGE